MKILDLDMDYFMNEIACNIAENEIHRLDEMNYGDTVWSEQRVRDFLEQNLGLSVNSKIKGRIVSGHNEALLFWKELIRKGELYTPFEVVHVDSHADLGLGYSSWKHILDIIKYPVIERPNHNKYIGINGDVREEGIGDYLLYAVAYRWISKITYCANPFGDKNDYLVDTLKNFEENYVWDSPVENIIQLTHNPNMELPAYYATDFEKKAYLENCIKEPEVPLLIIPIIEGVNFNGDFDYAVMAQSPNYTPTSADFIIDIFKEYIVEC